MSGWVVPVIVALLGAGLLSYVRDTASALSRRFRESTPEREERHAISDDLANADKSSLLLVRENTALATRNEQLYAELTSSDARHERERAAWQRRDAERSAEIDELERKLRLEIEEHNAKVCDLFDQLVQLRTKHGV